MTKLDAAPPADLATLPGASVLRRTRRVLIWTLGIAVAYGTFTGGSKGACAGGYSGDGSFIDSAGDPTTAAPVCQTIALGPSPLVFVAFAVIVLWSISAALRRAGTEAEAIRYLDRAVVIVAVTAVVSLVIAHVWFWNIPLDDPNGSMFFPFPFGSGSRTVTP